MGIDRKFPSGVDKELRGLLTQEREAQAKVMIEIRAGRAGDFEQVLLLLQELWPDRVLCRERLQAAYERGLASDTQYYLCAVEEGRVAGFCSLTLKNNLRAQGLLANLDEMVVHDADRGHGIGTRLLQSMIAFARERGCAQVELESAFHRTETHTFYESRGFRKRAYHFSLSLV
jgi:GNAT superfamily N-acetyltransferase